MGFKVWLGEKTPVNNGALVAGVLGLVAMLTTTSILTRFLFIENPLPIPDRGSSVFPTASEEAFFTSVEGFAKVFHVMPRYRLDTPGVKRAIYPDGMIINYTAPDKRAALGHPAGAKMFSSYHPEEDANALAKFLNDHGFTSRVEPIEAGLEIFSVQSSAFSIPECRGWIAGTRLPVWKMQRPQPWIGRK